MYIIINQNDLIKNITDSVKYVRRQKNDVIILCDESDAEAILTANTDRFYPLQPEVYSDDRHTLIEVDEIPDGVVPDDYVYRDGEFFLEEEKAKAIFQAETQASLIYELVSKGVL